MQPDQPFPSFSFPDIFDTPVSLDDYKGKYLILTIGSCGLADYRSYLPTKKEMYGKYRASFWWRPSACSGSSAPSSPTTASNGT